MPRIAKSKETKEERRSSPALTVEEDEDELVSLAINLAKKRLRDESASNDLVRSIIQYGTTKARLEKEKLNREIALLSAKTKAVEEAKDTERMFASAIEAMQSYGYRPPEVEEYDDDDI